MKKHNVLYIGPNTFPYGGATSKRIANQIKYLNKVGIYTHVLVTRSNPAVSYENPSSGIYEATDYLSISDLFRRKELLKYYNKGKQFIKSSFRNDCNNFAIFPTTCAFYDYPLLSYARREGYRIIFDKVETNYLQQWRALTLFRVVTCVLNLVVTDLASRRAHAFFAISSRLKQEEGEKYPKVPIFLLQNSTPVIGSSEKTSLNNRLQVFYAGTYGPKDGVEYLIKAVELANSRGVECELYLAGKGAEKCMKMLQIDSNSSNYRYLGFLSEDELHHYLLRSDLLAMTRINSKFANYGFPYKLSEYLSTGNIVIATKVSDVSIYLKDKESALIVEPESAESIADAIAYVKNNPERCLQIGRNGKQVMKKHFSIDAVGAILVNALDSISDGR